MYDFEHEHSLTLCTNERSDAKRCLLMSSDWPVCMKDKKRPMTLCIKGLSPSSKSRLGCGNINSKTVFSKSLNFIWMDSWQWSQSKRGLFLLVVFSLLASKNYLHQNNVEYLSTSIRYIYLIKLYLVVFTASPKDIYIFQSHLCHQINHCSVFVRPTCV